MRQQKGSDPGRFERGIILDKAGVIRFKDMRGQELDEAVATLLGEDPAEKSPQR